MFKKMFKNYDISIEEILESHQLKKTHIKKKSYFFIYFSSRIGSHKGKILETNRDIFQRKYLKVKVINIVSLKINTFQIKKHNSLYKNLGNYA